MLTVQKASKREGYGHSMCRLPERYTCADTETLQADWEDMNRKSTMFAALQQDEDAEDGDGDDGDAMATDKIEQPKSTMNAFASTAVSNPAGGNPAMNDEDEEIT